LQLSHLRRNLGIVVLLLYYVWLCLPCLRLNLLTRLMWPMLLRWKVELKCLTSHLRYLNNSTWLRVLGV
jgi:hypothetical protein